MLPRLARHVRANTVAYLALFVALGGTGAYAANTIGSSDVIDESLLSQDLKNGEVKTADLANASVAVGKLGRVPAASVFGAGAETVHTQAGTLLHATAELFDTANLHTTTANTERLRAPVDGTYVISATVDWEPSSTGARRVSLTGPNGALATVGGPPVPAPFFTSQNVSGVERLATGQTVSVQVYQDSGGDIPARLQRFEMTFAGR